MYQLASSFKYQVPIFLSKLHSANGIKLSSNGVALEMAKNRKNIFLY